MAPNPQIKQMTAVLLLSLHLATSMPAKANARPVHEVINEQSRIDENIRPLQTNLNLPYSNPLAGNSKQNARLHAQNQQAMFNAERVRQHRAQLQRWTKAPPQVDSYMKAYHESQESHQLALEQQQVKRENKQINPVTKPISAVTKAPRVRQFKVVRESVKSSPKLMQGAEPIRITKDDAIIKTDKNRNHRSYGSVEYQQHLQPKRYKTVYVSPAPTYDQGVTIKPNGNIGLTQLNSSPEESKLYTAAYPSSTQYVYPKQYSQMHTYQSAQDIDTLNALLKKNPTDQLSELTDLLNNKHVSSESSKDTLNTPIDLYFYHNNSPKELQDHYEHSTYAQLAPNYAANYIQESKDHTPITEQLDDIEDPNKHTKLRSYGLQSVLATQASEEDIETTTTKSNNYYKVEVASQTISAPYSAMKQHHYYKDIEEAQPTYQALQYRPTYPTYHSQEEGDLSERYLHHNAQHVGIQHLSGDGSEVSAYGDDNQLHYAANYEFGYRVRDLHSGNDFGHHELKKGDNTRGHYHVLLPDGRMQKVKYSAGPEGYHADISYDHLQ